MTRFVDSLRTGVPFSGVGRRFVQFCVMVYLFVDCVRYD